MPSFFIKTYGCQMNERDSEQVAQQLLERGYERAKREEEADVVLLNTCSVRDQAEQKALAKMRNLTGLKRRRRGLLLGYLGCMAQSRAGQLLTETPGVDLVVGTQQFHRVADYVDSLLDPALQDMDSLVRRPIVDVSAEAGSQNAIKDHVLAPKQVTAFVSIMQGCNMRCSFCIVPDTRGPERGRPIADIVAEVEHLVAQGIKEVTLLGQIVNLYGRHEFPAVGHKSPFVQLLERLDAVPGLERIRFTSPHPIGFRADLVEAFARLPKLCESVHLPLQSGSDAILKRMRRGYTADRYRRLVAQLRAARPEIAISTDIIVGFPGETEADYLATRNLVEEIGFDQAFIFRFSPRKDTPAATMPDQVDDDEKMRRNQDLLSVLDQIALQKTRPLVGRDVEILVEGPSKTNAQRLAGRTRTNRLVVFPGDQRHLGQLMRVRITETTGFTLYADPAIVGLQED
ncbi:MAG: tRNA (N6-isopentenyl adenosine(37)-C2)-methylthiotransferase MiaB [Candidatus Methylacidiphilales bacterium]